MHPELLSSLATERRRDIVAAMTASRASSARPAWRAPRVTMPRFRVSWTRTTLAAVAGSRRRGSSLVIVISATRTSGPGAGQAAVAGSAADQRSLVRAL
jgi:hypothetical protein